LKRRKAPPALIPAEFAGGSPLGALAIEVTFQPRERTLTDTEIGAASEKVVAAVTKQTGAILRG